MTKTLHTVLLLFLAGHLFGQGTYCDSTYTFAFVKNGKTGSMIMNGYSVVVHLTNGEDLELTPTPISYRDKDSLIIDQEISCIRSKELLCDSLTVMTYRYRDFEVSFNCAPLCDYGFMDLGIYIYHFSTIRQFNRYKKAGRAIVHPLNTWDLKKKDFPLTLVALNTEEFMVELELIE